MKSEKKQIYVELLIPVRVQMYAGWGEHGEVDIASAQVPNALEPSRILESLDEDSWQYLEERIAEACGPKPEYDA